MLDGKSVSNYRSSYRYREEDQAETAESLTAKPKYQNFAKADCDLEWRGGRNFYDRATA